MTIDLILRLPKDAIQGSYFLKDSHDKDRTIDEVKNMMIDEAFGLGNCKVIIDI
jgi:hypothetical protein